MRLNGFFFFFLLALLPSVSALYPMVQGAATTDTTTTGTSHVHDLPSNIQEGDLLLMFFTNDGGATVTPATGWTSVCNQARTTTSRANLLARRADGTEGSTVTHTTSATEATASVTYRIRKGSWHGQVDGGVDCQTSDPGGTTAAPNPASLTTDWQIAENLWFAYFGSSTAASVTAYPTGFVNGQHVVSGSGTGHAGASVAWYKERTQTVDPGNFTLPAAVSGALLTVAVKPSPVRPPIADLESDLRLRYSFTEAFTTASTVEDSSPYGNDPNSLDGTWNSVDTHWNTTGAQGLNVTTVTGLDYRNGFTAAGWFNPRDLGGVLMGSESSGSLYGWKLGIANNSGTSDIDLQVWDTSATQYNCRWFSGCTTDFDDPFPLNEWTHVVMTVNYETNLAQLYINGMPQARFTFSGDQVRSDRHHFFGRWGVSGGQAEVAMDDLRLYDRDIGYFGAMKLYRLGRAANDEGCSYDYGNYSVNGTLLCNHEDVDFRGGAVEIYGDGEVTFNRADGVKQLDVLDGGIATYTDSINLCTTQSIGNATPTGDSSGNGATATASSVAYIDQGNGYGYYYCDGVNSYIEGSGVTTDYVSSDSYSTHFKFQPGQVAFQSILMNRFNYGANEGYNLFADGNLAGLSENVLVFGQDFYYGGEDCQYAIDSWNSLTYTYSGSVAKVYINNCLGIDTAATGKNGNNANDDLRLCNEYGSQFFEGGVDDVAHWYDRVLTATEVEQLHNGSVLSDMATDLEVWWRFDNYTEKLVCEDSDFVQRQYRTTDRSGNNHDFMNYRAVMRDEGKYFSESVDSSLQITSTLGAGDVLPSYADTDPMAYMFIVKLDDCSVANYIAHLYSYGGNAGYDLRPTTDAGSTTCAFQWISPQGIFQNANSSRYCRVNEWCQITAWYDGVNRLQIWTDGVSVLNTTNSFGRNSSGTTTIIGAEGTAYNNINATIARASIFYRNITVEDMYNHTHLLPVYDAQVDLQLWSDRLEERIE